MLIKQAQSTGFTIADLKEKVDAINSKIAELEQLQTAKWQGWNGKKRYPLIDRDHSADY